MPAEPSSTTPRASAPPAAADPDAMLVSSCGSYAHGAWSSDSSDTDFSCDDAPADTVHAWGGEAQADHSAGWPAARAVDMPPPDLARHIAGLAGWAPDPSASASTAEPSGEGDISAAAHIPAAAAPLPAESNGYNSADEYGEPPACRPRLQPGDARPLSPGAGAGPLKAGAAASSMGNGMGALGVAGDGDASAGPAEVLDSGTGGVPACGSSGTAASGESIPGSGGAISECVEWREWRRGLSLWPVRGDGNCLFRCVAAAVYGDEEAHAVVRRQSLSHVWRHRRRFGAYITRESIQAYVERKQRDGTYGNHLEIQAMAELYCRRFEIFAAGETGPPLLVLDTGGRGADAGRDLAEARGASSATAAGACTEGGATARVPYRGSAPQCTEGCPLPPPVLLSYRGDRHYDLLLDPHATAGPQPLPHEYYDRAPAGISEADDSGAGLSPWLGDAASPAAGRESGHTSPSERFSPTLRPPPSPAAPQPHSPPPAYDDAMHAALAASAAEADARAAADEASALRAAVAASAAEAAAAEASHLSASVWDANAAEAAVVAESARLAEAEEEARMAEAAGASEAAAVELQLMREAAAVADAEATDAAIMEEAVRASEREAGAHAWW